MTSLGLLAGTLLAAATTSAGDVYTQCINSAHTNFDYAQCGQVYLKRLDAALNVTWKKAYASLDDKQSRMQLLQEQRDWIKFKDESCRFWANSFSGREGQVLHFYGCRGAIIEARISDLNGLYELTHQNER